MAGGVSGLHQVVVQDLPPSANEEFLRTLVQDIATVQEIIVKHKPDQRGRGVRSFAFLRFGSQAECEAVIAELNYTKLDGQPIRILLVGPRPVGGNLFVRGLDDTIDDAQLHDAFATFGEVLSCKIVRNAKGQSRGFAYVQFRHEGAAHQAKEDLRGAMINGQEITIEDFRKQRHAAPEETFTNVFVRDLPESVRTDQDLANLFAPYGEVTSPKLAKPGFGFCNMATHEAAVAAVKGLNGREIEGRKLYACRAKLKEERQEELRRESEAWRQSLYSRTKDRNLFVRNFPEELTDAQLRELFGRYGEVESVTIERGVTPSGSRAPRAYVLFKDEAGAARALRESALLVIGGRQLHVARFARRQQRARANIVQHSAAPRPAPVTTPASFPGVGAAPAAQFPVAYPAPAPPGPTFQAPASAYPATGFQASFPPMSPKDRLRLDVQDQFGAQTPLLKRLVHLSDEQARALTTDPRLYEEWIAEETVRRVR